MQFRALIKTILYFIKENHDCSVFSFHVKNCFSVLLYLIRITFSIVFKLIILQTVFIIVSITTADFQQEKKRGIKWLNVSTLT